MIKTVLTDMHEMEAQLAKNEDINWTVVRPPGLKNEPATGLKCSSHITITVYFISYVIMYILSLQKMRS